MVDLSISPLLSILIVFGLALLIQISIYLFNFLSLALYKNKQPTFQTPPVSVVICARNEEENLEKFLPLVLEQDYPKFEVIVVNDCSFDNSYDLLKSLAQKYKNLKVADIKEVEGREHGKKFAMTIGIKAAQYETLVLTDADCYPSSNHWISSILESYGTGKQIVLGYGKYASKPGFLNLMIRFDTFFIAAQYLSKALKGKAYMGVGRNLSYQKSLFFDVKGYASHIHLESGDDDLFINEVATSQNTTIVVDKGSSTVSEPKLSWKAWFHQKKRHVSTAKYYKSAHKSALFIEPMSWYFLIFATIASLIFQYNTIIIISGLLFRTLLQIGILHAIAVKLDEADLGWKAPFLEFFQRLFVYPVYFITTFFVRKRKWS
jgi:glycosyltransferase involved in cell wall biosynthesis